MSRRRKWTDEQLIETVKTSISISEVRRKLGLSHGSSFFKTFYRAISRLNLDTSHFKGQAHGTSNKTEPTTVKLCNECKQTKPVEEFRFKRKAKNKRQSICTECAKIYYKQRYHSDSTYKSSILKGLKRRRMAQKAKIAAIINAGICQICLQQTETIVDHDHSSGFIRGALCQSCNIGLGGFKDNIANLKNAIAYLTKEHTGILYTR